MASGSEHSLAIYCRRGPISAIAAAELSALGYVYVLELEGGMLAWQTSGRSLAGL
ncbi:MAG: rhodanese-like domain-containing protein [Candidatus Sericytochromatia bacterium]